MRNLLLVRLMFVLLIALAILLLSGCAKLTKPDVTAQIRSYSGYIVPVKGNAHWITGTGTLVELGSGRTGILTNQHVCEGVLSTHGNMSTIVSGTAVWGLRIIKWSYAKDLCLLHSPQLDGIRGLKMIPAEFYQFGEPLFILGYPMGRPQSAQSGRYIAERLLQLASEAENNECKSHDAKVITPFAILCVHLQRLHMTTVLTYPGNSGSPVFNDRGQLVGVINSADTATAQGNFISGKVAADFMKGQ